MSESVELRPWLDGNIPAGRGPGSLLAAGRADVEVGFIEMVDDSKARAYYPADSSNEIVAPVMEGRYFAGAICPAILGSDGRIAAIYPPLAWPEGGDPTLVGAAEADRVKVEQLQAEKNERFETVKEAFEEFVPSVGTELANALTRAQEAADEALAAKNKAQQALDDAFAAQGGVQGALAAIATLDERLTPELQAAQDAASQAGTAANQAKTEAQNAHDAAMAAITGSVTEYAVSSSETQAPAQGWSISQPTRTPGKFIWARTTVNYANGSSETASPVLVTGNTGADGQGIEIAGTVPTYAGLPSNLTSADAGKAYLVASDGLLYIWGGSAFPANGSGTQFRGPKGDPGDTGLSVSSILSYYLRATAKPAKPTVTSPSGWTLTEPAYVAGQKLFRAEKVTYTNGAFAWSDVSEVSAYTAASLAMTAADGKATITYGTVRPSSPKNGDRFYNSANGKAEIYSGSAWRDTTPGEGFVPALDIGSGTAGDLSVGRLTVVGGAQIPTAVIDTLLGQDAFYERMAANQMIVTPGNLLMDPSFKQKRAWSNSSYVQASGGRFGGGSLLVPAGTTQQGVYTGSTAASMVYNPRVVAGIKYKLSVYFNSALASTSGNKVTIYYRWYKEDGTNSWGSAYAAANAATFSANSWTLLEGETIECPVGATRLAFGLYVQSAHNAQVRFSDPAMLAMTGDILMENGAVNADKVTASQELSAKIAQFLEVETSKITWNNAAGNNAFLTNLVGQDAFLERLYANRIIVDTASNLWPNGWDEYTDNRGMNKAFVYNTTGTQFSGMSNYFAVAAGTGTIYVFNNQEQVSVNPGDTYILDVWLRASNNNTAFFLEIRDQAGSLIPNSAYTVLAGPSRGSGNYALASVTPTTSSTRWSIAIKIPTGVNTLRGARAYFNHSNGTSQNASYAFACRLRHQVGEVLIENGAVAAEKLAGKIVLASEIIAGDEAKYHTKLSQTGLQFFSKLKGITNPVQALAINTPGTDKEDSVFELRNPSDLASTTAMINVAGQASFSDLSVPNLAAFEDVAVKGRTLEAMIEAASPRLVLDSKLLGSVITGSWPDGTASANIARLAAVSIANPYDYAVTIMIQPTVVPVYAGGNMVIRAYWNYTVGNNPADPGKSYASAKVSGSVRTGAAGDKQVIVPAVPITIPAGQSVKAHLLCYGHASSGGTYSWTVPSAEEIVVQAVMMGALDPDWDTVLSYVDKTPTQSVTPGTAKKTYVMTVKSSWLRAFYRDSGAYNSYYAGKAVHGSYSNSASTAFKGAIGFDSFTAALAGSTVTKVRARVQLAHTYQGSGARIGVGLHTALNAPASMSGGSALATTGVITAGGAGWVTLPMTPAQHEQLRTGGLRGLLLYPPSNSTSVYGYASIAPNQYLEITYVK